MIYRFGIFEFDAAKAELRRRGLLVRIQDQPVRLLMALLEARGQILSSRARNCTEYREFLREWKE